MTLMETSPPMLEETSTSVDLKAALLARVLELFDRDGLPYCILQGYDNYPERVDGDVDLLVPTEAVPRRGSSRHQRWFPSHVMARPRPVSTPVRGCFNRRTAASPPGGSTVLRKSWWSYWCHTHHLSAMVGDASSASNSPDRSAPAGNRAASAGAGSAA